MSSNKEKLFYLARHGETDWNAERRMLSTTDIPLNQQGINQTKELATTLSQVPIEVIFTSDLSRAKQTAEIIRGDRSIPIIELESLREKNYGTFEGMSVSEVIKLDGESSQFRGRKAFNHKYDESIESDKEVADRIIGFLNDHNEAEFGIALVVTHSSVIRSLLLVLEHADYETLPHGSVSNCAQVILSTSNNKINIIDTMGISFKE